MRDFDLTSLRLFVAVCDQRSISRAAETAHIVGSAISKRMAQLDHLCGTALFTRTAGGMVPTPAGESLLAHARLMVAHAERMEREMLGYVSLARDAIQLLAATTAIAESLPRDVAAFLELPGNEHAQVNIEERDSNEIVHMVRDGAANLGICWDIANLQNLRSFPYASDELCIVTPPGHVLAGRTSVRFDRAATHPFVGMPYTSSFQVLLRRLSLQGPPLRYRMIVPTFDALLHSVHARVGLGLAPLEVVQRHALSKSLATVRIADSWAKRQFVICHRDETDLSPTVAALRDYLAFGRVSRQGGV